MVSTLKRAVTPDIFASRSRIIYQLAEGLQKRGHTVTLLGTKDSFIPGVKIIPIVDKPWTKLPPVENPFLLEVSLLMQQTYHIVKLQKHFDIIHNHTYPDFFPSIIENQLQIPMVSTMYALHTDQIDRLLSFYPKTYYIALSNAYKKLYQKAHIHDVIYAGVDINLYSFKKKKHDFLLWLGRLPEGKNPDGSFIDPKGVRFAIQVAQKTGKKLLLGGPCEDKRFFDLDVKPYLNKKIKWIGDVSSEQSLPIEKVVELMQNAKAFLMTINQAEPFGLVIAEAMSCGTPVIAYNRGSVPEIVKDNQTGFIVSPSEGITGLSKAVEQIYSMSDSDYQKMQQAARRRVEDNFSIDQMMINYERTYQNLIKIY